MVVIFKYTVSVRVVDPRRRKKKAMSLAVNISLCSIE